MTGRLVALVEISQRPGVIQLHRRPLFNGFVQCAQGTCKVFVAHQRHGQANLVALAVGPQLEQFLVVSNGDGGLLQRHRGFCMARQGGQTQFRHQRFGQRLRQALEGVVQTAQGKLGFAAVVIQSAFGEAFGLGFVKAVNGLRVLFELLQGHAHVHAGRAHGLAQTVGMAELAQGFVVDAALHQLTAQVDHGAPATHGTGGCIEVDFAGGIGPGIPRGAQAVDAFKGEGAPQHSQRATCDVHGLAGQAG